MFIMPVSMPSATPSRVIIGILASFHVGMVADNYLLPIITFVSSISFPVHLTMTVRGGLINDYLVSPVHIIGPASFR